MTHVAPSTRVELLAELRASRDDLLSSLDGLTEDQISNHPIAGDWTIKDVIGHLSYWEQVILIFVRETFTQGKPSKLAQADPDPDINGREAAKRKSWKWQRVRAEFENTRRALTERVNNLTDAQLAFQIPDPYEGDETFVSVTQLIDEANRHSAGHLAEITEWRNRN